jgi:hypothetical protein
MNIFSKIFSKKESEVELLEKINGQYNNISVTLSNFPCKKEMNGSSNIYIQISVQTFGVSLFIVN